MFHVSVLILTCPLFVTSYHLNFRKCCPLNEQFTENLTCTNEGINELNDLYWIPTHKILNRSNLQNLKEEEIKDAEENLRANIFVHGFPECQVYESTESFYHDDEDDDFRIILGENEHESGIFISNFQNSVNSSAVRDIKDDTLEPWLLPASDVCLDVTYDGKKYIYIAKHCPTNTTRWVRKCCDIQHIFNVSSGKCEKVPDQIEIADWRPQVSDLGSLYVKVGSTPKCKKVALLHSIDKSWRCRGITDALAQVTFLPNGSIQVNHNTTYDTNEYCGESTWHEGNRILHDNFIVCGESPLKSAKAITYGVLFIIGGVCLLITVSISLWLPELRTTMHNKVALTHNTTLMFAYFAWGISQIVPSFGVIQCTILSLIIQFTFLGSFVWLNALCIDMSSTFRKTRLASKGSWSRYFVYSGYVWGITISISILTAIMEFVEEPPFGILRPGISCYCGFARHNASILLYFYGPMAVALALNLVLYVLTTWKIIKVFKTAKILKKGNVEGGAGPQNDTQRLIVYTKLFVLMGLTWITEVIGWAVKGNNAFWFIMDIINLLRAIFIFILFICKRSILQSIHDRIKVLIYGEQEGRLNIATIHTEFSSTANRRTKRQTVMELKNRDFR